MCLAKNKIKTISGYIKWHKNQGGKTPGCLRRPYLKSQCILWASLWGDKLQHVQRRDRDGHQPQRENSSTRARVEEMGHPLSEVFAGDSSPMKDSGRFAFLWGNVTGTFASENYRLRLTDKPLPFRIRVVTTLEEHIHPGTFVPLLPVSSDKRQLAEKTWSIYPSIAVICAGYSYVSTLLG